MRTPFGGDIVTSLSFYHNFFIRIRPIFGVHLQYFTSRSFTKIKQ